MKKIILLVIAGIGLVSCTNDDFIQNSTKEPQEEVYLNKEPLDTTGGQNGTLPPPPPPSNP